AERLKFQSAPGTQARGNRVRGGRADTRRVVSIRPRHAGQGKHLSAIAERYAQSCFNPPPARRPGETTTARPSRPRSAGFNPPPARRPGETWDRAEHSL